MSLKTVFSSVALLSSVDSVVGLRLRQGVTSAPPSLDTQLGDDSFGKWGTVRAAKVVLGLGTEKINKSDCNSVNLKRHIEKSYDMLKPRLERFEDDCEGSAKKAKLEKSWVDEMDNLVRMHDKILADPKNDCRQENVADMLSLKDEYPTQLLVGEAAYAEGKQLLRESLERADAVKIEDEKHPQWFSLSGSTEKGNRRPANVSVQHWVDMRTSQMLKTALGNWKKRVSDLAAGVHFECKTDKELGHVFHFKSAVALALYTAEDVFGKLNWMARTGPFAPGADPKKLQDSKYYTTWKSLHKSLSATLEKEIRVHEIRRDPEDPMGENFGLWRGLGFPSAAIRDSVLEQLVRKDPNFSTRQIFKSQEFMSTSTDRKVAERYMAGFTSPDDWSKWEHGILFQIKRNHTGKSISEYSTWSAEEEVLYRPDTSFRVLKNEEMDCPTHPNKQRLKTCMLVVVEESQMSDVWKQFSKLTNKQFEDNLTE